MANINLSQESYVSYDGVYFFNACNVENVRFTPKFAPKTEKNAVPAILMHISGTQKTSGVIVDFDMWPRDNATKEELDKFFEVKEVDGKKVYEPKVSVDNIEFRVGYYPGIDANGEKKLQEGLPKWTAYSVGGQMDTLGGKKREFKRV
jgi:hypothetical protein